MADLQLWEHRKCPDLYCDPISDRIGRLKPDSVLSMRRIGDLLRLPLEDVSELMDSGALPADTDVNGKQIVYGNDLQKFTAALRPVTFTQTDETDETDQDAATDDAPDAEGTGVPVTTVAPTRSNPDDMSAPEPEAGWIRLRLSDLANLLRGNAGVADQAPVAPAPAKPALPAAAARR